MGLIVLFLLIVIPAIEIATFVQVGGAIGAWETAALTLLNAILGVSLVRVQGLGVLRRVQAAAERNEAPVREVFDGACLLLAGACLLIPGFVTDALGVLLLVPPVRLAIFMLLVRRARARGPQAGGDPFHGSVHHSHGFGTPPQPGQRRPDPRVVEAEFREVPTPPEGDRPEGDGDNLPPGPPRPH